MLLLKIHTVLGGILAGETCLDYLLWHIPTYYALGIVFSAPGKRKTILNQTLHWQLTHLLFFLFKTYYFFFIYKRKIIVGLPNIKTIIIVEDQDINETLGFGFYQHASNQNFNLAFSKKALEWYQGISPNRKHYISDWKRR